MFVSLDDSQNSGNIFGLARPGGINGLVYVNQFILNIQVKRVAYVRKNQKQKIGRSDKYYVEV